MKPWVGILVLVFANTAAAGAEWTSSALGTISQSFVDTPYWMITLINNVPNLCAVFFSLLAGLLVNRVVPLKSMMLFGIAFHCVGGVMPVFLSNATSVLPLLAARLIFGIGYGTMQGLGVSMSFKLVTDSTLRSHAFGWTQSVQFGMNMIAQIAVSYLAVVRWNFTFFIYFWSIIPFVIVLVFCPKFSLDRDDHSDVDGKRHIYHESFGMALRSLPFEVWVFSAIAALYMMSSTAAVLLNLSPIIVDKVGSAPSAVGYAMTFYSVSAILGGLLFGTVTQKLKHFTLFAYMLLVCIGVISFSIATSYTQVCAALFIVGLGATGAVVSCVSAYTGVVPANRTFVASSVTMSCVNIGAFLSSLYVGVFEALGQPSTATLVPSAVIMLALGIISIPFWKHARKHTAG